MMKHVARIFSRSFVVCLAGFLVLAATACNSAPKEYVDKEPSAVEIPEEAVSFNELTRVSVHDPSIISDDGTFYVLGSHIASAKSTDLLHWTQISTDYSNDTDAAFYGNLQETFAVPFQWAGYDDGDCSGGNYAIWAPDIIWDKYFEWDDGSVGAYLLYCCTSSTWRRSCIVCLASKKIDGEYSYVDTLIYSGFTSSGEADGNSTRNTKWDNDYLNLATLVDLGSAKGGIDEINDEWFAQDGTYNTNYAPNAIDPNLFFDAEGTTLYMSYGSWSGGLFLLEIDPSTGKAIYPGVDSVDEVSGNYVDRYFGVHLAGGNHQSGEAPYIVYDQESGYYYLYETYGSLTAAGGYNMRLFRSENPQGPYLDAAGRNAAESGADNDTYGIKVMGNYQFYAQTGVRSAGHNSVLIDGAGNRFLVYHQRFDTGTEYHELRVHQQFLNEDLWPVTAVYEYRGDVPANYDDTDVIGTYEFIDHGTATDKNMLTTLAITLCEDGTVEGSATGTWSKSDSNKGYDYITLVLDDGATYKGIFFLQHKETFSEGPVMTFTAIGDNNQTVWGSMIDTTDTDAVLDIIDSMLETNIKHRTTEHVDLPQSLLGATISWSSSDPDRISTDGVITSGDEQTKVVLTATISLGDQIVEKTFSATVKAAD